MTSLATVLVLAIGLAVGASNAVAQTPACAPLAGDRILAKDLAAVLPEFAAVPPLIPQKAAWRELVMAGTEAQ